MGMETYLTSHILREIKTRQLGLDWLIMMALATIR